MTLILVSNHLNQGGLAQLARALALHARGHRFDSDILHNLVYQIWGLGVYPELVEGISSTSKRFDGVYPP